MRLRFYKNNRNLKGVASAMALGLSLSSCAPGLVGKKPLRRGSNQNAVVLQNSALSNCSQPDHLPLRRLSHTEYDNVIRDLLGKDLKPSKNSTFAFPSDGAAEQFSHLPENVPINDTTLKAYLLAAKAIAGEALTSPQVMSCEGTAVLSRCTETIARDFMERAFRRPVDSIEFQSAWSAARSRAPSSGNLHNETLRAHFESILVSPHFLFHLDENSDHEEALPDWKLASRLSFFFYRSLPDQALWADVKAGILAETIDSHIERLISDPKAVEAFARNFVGQWLGASNGPLQDLPAELESALETELSLVVRDFILKGRDVRELFHPGFTYLNRTLASHYNISGNFDQSFRKVETQDRGGILQWGAFYATQPSRPTIRGLKILDTILCERVGAPTGVDIDGLVPQETLRKTIEPLQSNPSCMGCHARMDPLGFAVDGYSLTGRSRSQNDLGDAIDSTGRFEGRSFTGARDMSYLLRDHPKFTQCLSRQLHTYAISRLPSSSDSCTLDGLESELRASQYNMRSMVETLLRSKAMRAKGVKK